MTLDDRTRECALDASLAAGYGAGIMIFARWVAAVLLAVGLANLIAGRIGRRRPSAFAPGPSEDVVERLQKV